MLKTIKSRLVITEIILLVCVIGGSSFLYFLFADEYYIHKKMQLIDKAYQEFNTIDFYTYFENIEKEEQESSSEELNTWLTAYEKENVNFIIADEYYNKVYITNFTENRPRFITRIDRNIKQRINSFSVNAATVYDKDNGTISLSGIIKNYDKKYFVYIYELTYMAEKNISYINRLLIITLIVAVIIGSILIYISADKISKPIKEIDNTTKNIADKDFSHKVREDFSYIELSGLAKSINTMSNQIQEYILELEKYNLALQEENRYKSELEHIRKMFVNNVSHELKTPLTIISSQVEMLSYLKEEKEKEKYYSSIIEEVNQMSDMISSMLTIFSVEQGLEEMDMELIDLSEIVNRLIIKYDALFQNGKIKYQVSVEQNCIVEANRQYIEMVINNYIINAYKHTEHEKQIIITLSSQKESVLFSVYNDGQTITEEEQDKIWHSFYQGKYDDAEQTYEGTGLGLYIVKNIINLHHGTCGVFNKENGVTFWFSLQKQNS